MAGNIRKQITLTCYQQNHIRQDWRVNLEDSGFEMFFIELADDLSRFNIELDRAVNTDMMIDINSYADVLNAVRIASPSDGFTNLCIGHIIGKSPNRDLKEDIKRAVNRVAFAPETIMPEDNNRKVCHNCGCGC